MDHRRITRSHPAPPERPWWKPAARKWRRDTRRTWAAIVIPAIAGVAAAWAVHLLGPAWAIDLFGPAARTAPRAPGAAGSAARDPGAGPAGAPLTVNVSRSDDPSFSQCIGWLFPQGLGRVPVFNFQGGGSDTAAAERWALRNNGIDVGNGTYQVIVTSNSARPVWFQVGIAAVGRRPAPRGDAVYNGDGCGGGPLAAVFYQASLDLRHPVLLRSPAVPGRAAQPTFLADDPGALVDVVLQASTASGRYEYSYVYQIHWRQGPRSGTIRIAAPSGQPFTLAPPASVVRSCSYAPGGWDCAS